MGITRKFPQNRKLPEIRTNGAVMGCGVARALAESLVVMTVTLAVTITSAESGIGGAVDGEDGV